MNQLENFLLFVREATKTKRLVWTKERPGEYLGSGPVTLAIREVVPLIAGPTETAGPQAFEIEVERVRFTVWNGTTPFDSIQEILAETFPDWTTQRDTVVARLADATKKLLNP